MSANPYADIVELEYQQSETQEELAEARQKLKQIRERNCNDNTEGVRVYQHYVDTLKANLLAINRKIASLQWTLAASPAEAPQSPVSARGETPSDLSPPSGENPREAVSIPVRVIAAAYDLIRQGKAVTIKAACERAVVNRSHFSRTYHKEVELIKALAASSRDPLCGSKEKGNVEADEDD